MDGRQYEWVQQFLDILESASSPEEFLSHTKMQLFPDQVFCFTPKGRPEGVACRRDAGRFRLCGPLGDRQPLCRRPGSTARQMPLRTALNNGDRVEIVTANSLRVTPEWERFVVTGRAKAHIRRHVRLRRRRRVRQARPPGFSTPRCAMPGMSGASAS